MRATVAANAREADDDKSDFETVGIRWPCRRRPLLTAATWKGQCATSAVAS